MLKDQTTSDACSELADIVKGRSSTSMPSSLNSSLHFDELQATMSTRPASQRSIGSARESTAIPSSAADADRERLCDAVLASHFAAATQGVKLEGLEDRAARADERIFEFREELAEAEAQQAVQSVKWKQKYVDEATALKAVEDRLRSSEAETDLTESWARKAKAEAFQVEGLRSEVAERGALWAEERERLLGQVFDLEAKSAERESKMAGYELQAHSAAESAAKASVERCMQSELLAEARAEAGKASAQTATSDAARILAEDRRLRAESVIDTLEADVASTMKSESNAIETISAEVAAQAEKVREAESQLHEVEASAEKSREELTLSRRREEESKSAEEDERASHTNTRKALEELLRYVELLERGGANDLRSSHSADAQKDRKEDEKLAARLKDTEESEAAAVAKLEETVAAESATAAQAQTEMLAMNSAQRTIVSLREELQSQRGVQKELHSELQALSSAAAAVRAVARAKDQTIQELQAAHRKLSREMSLCMAVSKKETVTADLKPVGASANGFEVGALDRTVLLPTGFQVNDQEQVPQEQKAESAHCHGDSIMQTKLSTASTSMDTSNTSSSSPQTTKDSLSDSSHAAVPVVDQIARRELQIGSHLSPQPSDQTARENADMPSLNLPQQDSEASLQQATAFLNAAAAKAAAAASAVEAFIPLFPGATAIPEAERSNDAARTASISHPYAVFEPTVVSTPSPTLDTQDKTERSRRVSGVSKDSSPSPPSWDEAQAAMTNQIKNDILNLRRAISDAGMTGSAFDFDMKGCQQGPRGTSRSLLRRSAISPLPSRVAFPNSIRSEDQTQSESRSGFPLSEQLQQSAIGIPAPSSLHSLSRTSRSPFEGRCRSPQFQDALSSSASALPRLQSTQRGVSSHPEADRLAANPNLHVASRVAAAARGSGAVSPKSQLRHRSPLGHASNQDRIVLRPRAPEINQPGSACHDSRQHNHFVSAPSDESAATRSPPCPPGSMYPAWRSPSPTSQSFPQGNGMRLS